MLLIELSDDESDGYSVLKNGIREVKIPKFRTVFQLLCRFMEEPHVIAGQYLTLSTVLVCYSLFAMSCISI